MKNGAKPRCLGDLSFVSLGLCHAEVHRPQLKYLEIETSLQCKILELFIAEICETLRIFFFFFCHAPRFSIVLITTKVQGLGHGLSNAIALSCL